MKQNKVIIIRIDEKTSKKYNELLNNHGMNLSKRIKLLIKKDIENLNDFNKDYYN